MRTKNKYEAIEIIDVDDKLEIADEFIDRLYNTDKTVAVFGDIDLVESILDDVNDLNETSIKFVDFRGDFEGTFYIAVNDDGEIVVRDASDFDEFADIGIAFIDMDCADEKTVQEIIDYFVNEDKEVILFGYPDDMVEHCGKECGKTCHCGLYDESPVSFEDDQHGFTMRKTDDNGYRCVSFYSTDENYKNKALDMIKDIWNLV